MTRGAVAEINLTALRHNYRVIKQQVNQRSVLAMVKSNAYGHGLARIARALPEADAFGVASLQEACILRDQGITQPIVAMSGFFDQTELPTFIEQQITAVVHNHEQLILLQSATFATPLKVWVKVDTGMHRLGFAPHELPAVINTLQQLPQVDQDWVLMTHLADADNLDHHMTKQQLQAFNPLRSSSHLASIANSAAILAHPDSHADWVRPGIMLYGVSPFSQQVASDYQLRPVMTLSARIIACKNVAQGETIGYGCTFQCSKSLRVAIVAIGYGDGYPRHAKNGTPTLVNQVCCPLVGRVSMDLLAIDISACPSAQVGDRVILWGEGLPAETVALHADTIAYELLCHVSQRVEVKENNND